MKTLRILIPSLLVLTWIAYCKKPSTSAELIVKMCDSHPAYNSVKVDVAGITVHYRDEKTGEKGWITLRTQTGVYDVLKLQNNLYALLSYSGNIPPGHIDILHIDFGTRNSVTVNNTEYPLAMSAPADSTKGVDVQVDYGKRTEVMLDFDVQHSIIPIDDTHFLLQPVITVENIEYTGL
jgi:hypothetical protein